jgi:hypothetical protein
MQTNACVRHECLDGTMIRGRRQLGAVLEEYVEHYNRHRGLELAPPEPPTRAPSPTGAVICQPLLSGLVNEYTRRAA